MLQAGEVSADLAVELNGRRYRVAGRRRESAAFWDAAAQGRWEDDTFRFLDAVTDPGSVLVDVGAWIGPLSLYASPRVARVLAIEPDPVAHAELAANIAANAANVEIWNAAVDRERGELKLYAPKGFGNSETTSSGEGEALVVKAVTFEDIDAAVGTAERVVLKMDIEGHEYAILDDALRFAARRRAPVHLSLHPRSFWVQRRSAAQGWLGSRRATFEATWAAIEKLAVIGPVLLSSSGAPVTRREIFRLVFLKKRPKNFSVEVRSPTSA
jgi:FkbM family methyltransferase